MGKLLFNKHDGTKAFALTIFFGGAAVATAITAPLFVGAPLTFIGGVFGWCVYC